MNSPGGASDAAGHLSEGERVILSLRPDPAYIVLAPMWTLFALGAGATVAVWAIGRWPEWTPPGATPGRVWLWTGLLAGLRVAWQAADRAARQYVLTNLRILRIRGVFQRSVIDAPLDRIQHVTITRLLRERLTGLGTLGFATAGTAWTEVHWLMVSRPAERLEAVRRAIDAAKTRRDPP